MTVEAAIVGLGWWGKTLVRAVQGKSEAIRFRAGATGRRALAEDFAGEQGFALRDSFEEVLADPAVEAVVLATPHLDHADQVVAAARAGKHVFVEKPFTLDRASAERATAAAAEAGVVLGLGHNRRFHPNMERLRALVASGGLGTILHAEGTMTAASGLFLSPESWRVDPHQSPAGGMGGLGIHMVDAMIDVVGPIAEVLCQSLHRAVPTGAEDTTSILLRFRDGPTGMVSCMTATAPYYRFCIYGSKGVAEIASPSLETLTVWPTPEAPPSGHPVARPPERFSETGVETVRLELEAFARAVRGEAPFPIRPDEMVEGASAFEAIARSAGNRTWERVA